MNAGPDVERLISDWLVEEAPARAPDRILRSVARVVDRTKQRRLVAAGRETMTFSIARLVAVLAIIVVVVGGGAAWLGRATAGNNGPAATQPSPSSPPTLAPSGSSLDSYRVARDGICEQFIASQTYDVADWRADPAGAIAFLQQVEARVTGTIDRLSRLDAPPAIRDEHASNLQTARDTRALIQLEIQLLQAGKVDEAQAVDQATEPLNEAFQGFERKYGLTACP